MNSNVWRWYLAAFVAVAQYYFVSAAGAVPNGTVYSALGATAVVAMVAGIAIHRPLHTMAWAFAAISLVLFLAGDYVYANLAASQAFVSFPSTADWLYLAMYPVLALGIAVLVRRLAPHRSWKAAGWGIAFALAAAGVLHFLYMGDYIAEPLFDTKMRAVAVAYPVLDAVMFGVAAWLLVIARRQSPSLVMVALGLVSMVVGNAIYNVQSIDGSFGSGGLADLFWIMFAALFGLACLHPSMKSTALSAPLGELGGHAVVASESALAETERLVRLDLPAMSETAYSSVESNTQV
jgi:hypothetical protein|tara:strand:+ start:1959 stop:2837 length:879 start_codon:yes stop_codon:yes gene_type:complete